ncbi:WhiB family transcriptional regulator [Mycobacteroides abscessus]|uniref:WhiB family transcriptional regulator n=1 Tax=Mycobacteroides abscessus TaxID=36809 RepID=UPI00266D9A8B|nr:WhiB family transcriptional regulator [Mycobacteroides abscessus]MDO3331391.1 WhiB family transcriptional regulator [Mycobacteroides abscessus subsp. abscessus]
MTIDDAQTDPSDAGGGEDQGKNSSGWDLSDGYWFAKPFHVETPRDLADVEGAEAKIVKSGRLVPENFATPCREGHPDRFHPDVDGLTGPQLRSFKRLQLAELAAECDTCPFRIGCAITALETDAISGVWAGVLTRDFPSANAWHRHQLLQVLAEYIIGYRAADPETIRPVEELIYSRIEVLLQRQGRLQPVLVEELAEVERKLREQAEFVARFLAAEADSTSELWRRRKYLEIEALFRRRRRLQPVFLREITLARKRLGIKDTTAFPAGATSAGLPSPGAAKTTSATPPAPKVPKTPAPKPAQQHSGPAARSTPVGKGLRGARKTQNAAEQLELEFAVSA